MFGFVRIHFYQTTPHLARKWFKQDVASIIYRSNHHNFTSAQYAKLIYSMSWYNRPAERRKYHLWFPWSARKAAINAHTYVLKAYHKHIAQLDKTYSEQIPKYLLQAMNKERGERKLSLFKIDPNLQKIANARVKYASHAYDIESPHDSKLLSEGQDTLSDNLIHGYDNHTTSDDIARQLKISIVKKYGPNAQHPNTEYIVGIGENAGPIYTDNNKHEHNNNPKEIADNSVHNMMYHDGYAYNGHRKNILSKYATSVGIAAYFHGDPHKQSIRKGNYINTHGALVEEFQ